MSIYCNSDYTQNFTLRGKLNQPVVLPPTADIEIVFVHSASKERYVANVSNGMVILTDPTVGKFSLQLPATFTQEMKVGEYNIVAHRVDDQRTRLFGGFVTVAPEL